jgi:hypothetical protein
VTDANHLVDRAGLPAAGDREASAIDFLVGLGYGAFVDGTGAPRPATRSSRWLRVRGMPPPEHEGPPPFEHLLTTLAGVGTQLELVVQHRPDAGMELFIGCDQPRVAGRVRSLLAPGCDVEPGAAATVEAAPTLGLVHRLQGGVQPDGDRPRPEGLLHRLAGIDGTWSILVTLDGTRSQDIDGFKDRLLLLGEDAARQTTTTRSRTSGESATVTSPTWTRVQEWLDTLYLHAVRGRAIGMWAVSMWATAADGFVLGQVVASLRAAVPGEGGRSFAASALDCREGAPAPFSMLTSADVGAMFAPPDAGVPGLGVRRSPPAGRRPPRGVDRISLGTYWCTDIEASVSVDDLEGHAFLTGTTGSGKTTTLHRLLAEAWNEHRIPFLVIDPVKDEYSGAAALFDGGVQVLTGQALRLNLLEPWPGRDERAHVAQIAQAFRGAFTMPSPTPYVVTHLFDEVAGLPGGSGGVDLHDVRDLLDPLILRLGYAPEAEANIRASLATRLDVLLSPLRAHRFAWPDSSMVRTLFDGPTVVTLSDVPDDEERAFLVLLLTIAAWSRARTRHARRPVDHLLVLEEAHRVIPETDTDVGDPERGSAAQVSAAMLGAMLAEVRSYGQQVIVVDQSPSKVSSEVLRNTNLKLVHRTVHPSDQAEVGAAIGLKADHAGLLGSLDRGQVLVSSRGEPAAQTFSVAPAIARFGGDVSAPTVPTASWACCSAQTPAEAEHHYRAWIDAPAAAAPMALFLTGLRTGTGDGKALRQAVYEDLLARRSTPASDTDCMAWTGLRRILTRERTAGLIASRRAFDQLFTYAFQAWTSRADVTSDPAASRGLKIAGHCTRCGASRCAVREPAGLLSRSGPRTGPSALAGPSWREAIPDVVRWGQAERARLEPLLGPTPAAALIRCQLAHGATAGGLPPEAIDHLNVRIATPAPGGTRSTSP